MRYLLVHGGLLFVDATATVFSISQEYSLGVSTGMVLGCLGLYPAIDRCAAAIFAHLNSDSCSGFGRPIE